MDFVHGYVDLERADAYATLEFANTYYLAYRDLTAILAEHVNGARALDFGCGTGRSTRFLRNLGFNVTGMDGSENMVRIARATDSSGDDRLVPDDNFDETELGTFDLILSAFTFDNIPGPLKKRFFRDLRKLLQMELSSTWFHRPRFTPMNGLHLQPRIFRRMPWYAAAIPSALSLPTARIAGLSKTSLGQTNLIWRCIEKRTCNHARPQTAGLRG